MTAFESPYVEAIKELWADNGIQVINIILKKTKLRISTPGDYLKDIVADLMRKDTFFVADFMSFDVIITMYIKIIARWTPCN